MKKLGLILSTVAILGFCAMGCDGQKHRKAHVKVYHLKDGRYCYEQKNGKKSTWYWLEELADGIDLDGDEIDSDLYTSTTYTPTDNFRPPAGTHWVSATTNSQVPTAPSQWQIAEVEPAESVVVTDSRGHPEVDEDGNLVDPDQLAPDESFDATDDTADDASADSGDTGDAGDTGGDGGGDGGGGDGGGD